MATGTGPLHRLRSGRVILYGRWRWTVFQGKGRDGKRGVVIGDRVPVVDQRQSQQVGVGAVHGAQLDPGGRRPVQAP